MDNKKLDLSGLVKHSCISHLLPKNQLFELINVPGADEFSIDIHNSDLFKNIPITNDTEVNENMLINLRNELMVYNQNPIKFEPFEPNKDLTFDKKKLGLSKLAELLLPTELLSIEKINTVKQEPNKRKRDDSEEFEVQKVIIRKSTQTNDKENYHFDPNKLLIPKDEILDTIHKDLLNIIGSDKKIDISTIDHLIDCVDRLGNKHGLYGELGEPLLKIVEIIKQDTYTIAMIKKMLLIVKVVEYTTKKLLNFQYLDSIFTFIAEYSQDIHLEKDIENIVAFAELMEELNDFFSSFTVIDSWDLNRIILSLQYILDFGTDNYAMNSVKFNRTMVRIKSSTTEILAMIFENYPLQRDLILDLIMNSFDRIPSLKEKPKFMTFNNAKVSYFTYNLIKMLKGIAKPINHDATLPNILEISKHYELEMLSHGVIITDMIIEKIVNNMALKGKLVVYSKDLINVVEDCDNVVADYLLSSLINKLINVMDDNAMGKISLQVLSELGGFILQGKDKWKKDQYFENLFINDMALLKQELNDWGVPGSIDYMLKKLKFINEVKEYMDQNDYKEFNKQVYNDFESLIMDKVQYDLKKVTYTNWKKLPINHMSSLNYYELYIKVLLDTINNPKLQVGAIKNFSILINKNKGLIKTKFINDLMVKILKEEKVIIKEVILNFIKQDLKYIELFINEIEFNVANDSLNIRNLVLSINKIVFEESKNERLKFYGLKGIFKLVDDENDVIKDNVKAYLQENVFEPLIDDFDEDMLKMLIKLANEDETMVGKFSDIMSKKELVKMFKNINHELVYGILVQNQKNDIAGLNSNILFINNLLQHYTNIINKQDLVILLPLLNLNNSDLKLRLNIFKIVATNLDMIKADVKVKNEINNILMNDLLKYQLNELENLMTIIVSINNTETLTKLYESLIVTLNNSDNDNKLKKLIISIVSFIIHSNMSVNSNSVINKLCMIFDKNDSLIIKSIIINQLLKLCNKTPSLYSNTKVLSLLDNIFLLANEFNALKKEIVLGLTNYMRIQEANNDDITLNLIVKYTPKVLMMIIKNDESMNNIIYKYIKNLVFFKIINPMTYLPYIVPLVIHEKYHIETLDLEFNDINILSKGTSFMLQSFVMNDNIENLRYYSFVENLLSLGVDISLILKIFLKQLKANQKNNLQLIFLTVNILKIVHKFDKSTLKNLIDHANIIIDGVQRTDDSDYIKQSQVLRNFLKYLNIQYDNNNYVNFEVEDYDFAGLK